MSPSSIRPSSGSTGEFLASIVESSHDAIFGLTLDGTIVSWNKAAESMYGYSANEIIGRPVILLSPPERAGEIEENLERLGRGQAVPYFETVRLRKTGEPLHVSIRVSPVQDADGATTGAAVIARDITEQVRAREASALATRVKQQFLDNMSHEIRTPLNGILGMTELVLETELTMEQRENLGLVKVSAETLLAVVDDVLDFSQMDSGKLQLQSIPFDFRESLAETMKMMGIRAQKKGLELVYEVDSEVPPTLLGDPGRIRRILYNVVGNAVKFTERGEVLVTIRQVSRDGSTVRLLFSVKDTGIGIPPEKRQAIFEPFSQGDSSMSRRHGGAGLGLAIVRRVVDLMQGDIWLESEPGKGSTFHFTIQLKEHPGVYANSAPLQLAALRDLAVLIVDDSAVSRRVLRAMLNRWGMRATDVGDGAAAQEALRIARDIGCPFAVVLLDVQMEKTDGFKIAEQVSKDSGLTAATVMMLTSVGHLGDAARCRDCGIAAYLVKPVGLHELVNAICLALDKTTSGQDLPLVTRHMLRELKDRLAPTS